MLIHDLIDCDISVTLVYFSQPLGHCLHFYIYRVYFIGLFLDI